LLDRPARTGGGSTDATVQATSTTEAGSEKGFAAARFSRPTVVTNRWFPLTPGTQFVYEGQTVEGGKSIPHRVVFTVTDLTKMVEGVRNVVIWDRDFTAGTLEETELAFFAQADDGTIWHFGQYPEVYQNGKFTEAPAWVYPREDSRPGITVKAEPRPGAPSYSQGWGPRWAGTTARASTRPASASASAPAATRTCW
jgi:hypothetical protein